jgi:hypothetical protein
MKGQGRFLSFTVINCFILSGCLEYRGEIQVKDKYNSSEFTVEGQQTGDGQQVDTGLPDIKRDDANPFLSTGTNTNDYLEVVPVEGLIINQGALITNNSQLSVVFDPPFDTYTMRFSETADCSAGTWVEYTPTMLYTTANSGLVTLSVQFTDWDNIKSECYHKQIIIDNKGPDIVFNKYPATSVEEGSSVEIIYTITDSYSPIKAASCEFAGVAKPCPTSNGYVQIPALAEGDYQFKVTATDDLNNSSEKSITFKVTALYKRLAKSISVVPNQKVDILFVIDNSGSMEYEQKSMASRVRNFLDVVHGLDWQIGVTTTDPNSKVSYGDGQLVPMKGLKKAYILNSSMNESDSKEILSNTLHRSESGSGLEQGILATYRALERGQSAAGPNRDLIRDGAHLAVVLISDEDESANEMRNDPNNLVKYIQTTYNQQKNFSFHSIITRPGDKQCIDTYGYREGFLFETMAKLTGGVVGDVCASDYAAQMQGVAEGVRKTLKTLTLSCEPVINATRDIKVQKDGQAYLGTYLVQGVNIVFDDELPQGEFLVDYSCVK